MIGDTRVWTVLDHCCRHCLGRVLQSGDTLLCAQCGTEETIDKKRKAAPTHRLCCCGLSEAVGAGRHQPFKCTPNPAKSKECSAEISVSFGDVQATVVPRQKEIS